MLRQKSWIDQANELVNISDVLSTLNVYVPEAVRNGSNKKVFCPFGFYHSDGGITKAMRIYKNSNSAYCFSCSKKYSSVSLASAAWDCSWDNAAFRLLDIVGFKPKTLEERWADATEEISLKPDVDSLAEALKTYCSSLDTNWAVAQLEDDIATVLNKCLGLLNSVKTNEDATKWLAVCKEVMRKKLGKDELY